MEKKASCSEARMERRPSIEREPRTLSPRQLHSAREAALYILNTKTLEEAVGIFTEGLQPVLSLAHQSRKGAKVDEDLEESNCVAETVHSGMSRHLLARVRDIVSAPF